MKNTTRPWSALVLAASLLALLPLAAQAERAVGDRPIVVQPGPSLPIAPIVPACDACIIGGIAVLGGAWWDCF